MRHWLLNLLIAVLGVSVVVMDADARRLGGGGSSGMRRTVPQTPPAVPPTAPQKQQQAAPQAPATPAPGAAQAAPRRSWLGPIAGIAAGLGLAALFSHFGLGAGLANMVTLLLLVMLGFMVLRWIARRFAGAASPQPAGAAAGMPRFEPAARTLDTSAPGGSRAAPVQGVSLPADFDVAAFERNAKLIFNRMQAANDAADVDDLRRFTTPEMFAAAQLDLQERRGRPQRTDVLQLEAQVVDLAHDDGRDIVSVRYRGLVREEAEGDVQPFDEVWHLARTTGSGEWRLAGIQPHAA